MEQKFYDALLVELTARQAVYQWQGNLQHRSLPPASDTLAKHVGLTGVLVVSSHEETTDPGRFSPYVEQRLRRATQYDMENYWGWKLNGSDCPLLIKAGIVPGIGGETLEEDTYPVLLSVPRIFSDLCREFGQEAEFVLRGFIADVCDLQNNPILPRDDGYKFNGDEARHLARNYLEGVYWSSMRT